MTRNERNRLFSTLSVAGAVVATALGSVQAATKPAKRALELPLSEAKLYFELNNTDGDLGIHCSADGGPWSVLTIEDPRDRVMLRIYAQGRLRQQGMTQLFFESAEPSFDELAPEEFFRRFPEGEYEIEALALNGNILEGEVMISHVMAAPVGNVTLSGEEAADSCDDELPVISGPVVIDWDPVTMNHPEIGKAGPVTISRYQFFVEIGNTKLAVDLDPSITEFQVPEEILALGTRFKFEIIATTQSGNNTAIESCFLTE